MFLAHHGQEVINPKLPDDDFGGTGHIARLGRINIKWPRSR